MAGETSHIAELVAAAPPVIVHVESGVRGARPAELLPDVQRHRPHIRKVIYTDSRTAAWVAASRILDFPEATS